MFLSHTAVPPTPHTRAPQVAALFNEYQRQAVLYPGGSAREWGCRLIKIMIMIGYFFIACFKGYSKKSVASKHPNMMFVCFLIEG